MRILAMKLDKVRDGERSFSKLQECHVGRPTWDLQSPHFSATGFWVLFPISHDFPHFQRCRTSQISHCGENADDDTGLRLRVEKGGCAGMQYVMALDQPKEDDVVESTDGVSIIIDQESLGYLRGCQIDYVDSLSDAGFKLTNPNAARSCGCGTSFEPQTA
jgi:iron-sulfur cluster assembly accessory protein